MKWCRSLASAATALLTLSAAVAKDEVEDTVSSHVERVRQSVSE
jgi:hypothetical protein